MDTLTAAKAFCDEREDEDGSIGSVYETMAAFADKHAGEVLDEFIKRMREINRRDFGLQSDDGLWINFMHAMASVAAEMKGE